MAMDAFSLPVVFQVTANETVDYEQMIRPSHDKTFLRAEVMQDHRPSLNF